MVYVDISLKYEYIKSINSWKMNYENESNINY